MPGKPPKSNAYGAPLYRKNQRKAVKTPKPSDELAIRCGVLREIGALVVTLNRIALKVDSEMEAALKARKGAKSEQKSD